MPGFSVVAALKRTIFFGLSLAWTAVAASPLSHSTGAPQSCPANSVDEAASLTQAARTIACDVRGRPLLIVGDYHGSNEIPRFVAQLMSDAAAERPVRLGLEMESFEQNPIDIYMASHGTAADRAALLHDDFWTEGDGRVSEAIVRLIERARKLSEEGRDVEVFTTISDYPGQEAIKQAGGENAYRSASIAQAIHGKVEHGAVNQLVIAFMGDAHSAYIGPARGSESTVTERLLADSPYVVNLDLHGGSTWGCNSDSCGPHVMAGKAMPTGRTGILRRPRAQSGQPTQVSLRFPRLTPSPPAKEKKQNH